MKKFEDLKIPLEEAKSRTKDLIDNSNNNSKPCTSKSIEIASEEEEEDDEKRKKQEKRLNQLKIAPLINLDELQFLGASTLPIDTENGLYHHKDDKSDQVNVYDKYLRIYVCKQNL